MLLKGFVNLEREIVFREHFGMPKETICSLLFMGSDGGNENDSHSLRLECILLRKQKHAMRIGRRCLAVLSRGYIRSYSDGAFLFSCRPLYSAPGSTKNDTAKGLAGGRKSELLALPVSCHKMLFGQRLLAQLDILALLSLYAYDYNGCDFIMPISRKLNCSIWGSTGQWLSCEGLSFEHHGHQNGMTVKEGLLAFCLLVGVQHYNSEYLLTLARPEHCFKYVHGAYQPV